jgi:hypothetical protein
MDQIIWIIVGVLGIGLVIGYFVQIGDSRKISEALKEQALERNGTLKPGTLFSFPRLTFPYGRTAIEVYVVGGNLPVTGVAFPIDLPETSFKIRNRSARLSTQKALGMMQVFPTGDPGFDERFFVETKDERLTLDLLNRELREQLLGLDEGYGRHKILARLQQNQFQLSIDTFGRDEAIFTKLIETAITFYDRLAKM